MGASKPSPSQLINPFGKYSSQPPPHHHYQIMDQFYMKRKYFLASPKAQLSGIIKHQQVLFFFVQLVDGWCLLVCIYDDDHNTGVHLFLSEHYCGAASDTHYFLQPPTQALTSGL